MSLEYVLLQGDNLEGFAKIENNTVESIVCDPPYGLKFMEKGWDSIGDGADQREWHRAWLTEAYRVIKPNGIIKAFSGTRTFHHLLYMMEEVGFTEVKVEAWTYGCLCEDTEILTDKGWLSHKEIDAGSMVVAYSLEGDHFDLQEVQEMLRYGYKDTAYRIYSDDTDQLVSKNHRCIVEREGERTFHLAEHLQAKEVVPFVEGMSVQGLQQTFSNGHHRSWQEEDAVYEQQQAQHLALAHESVQALRPRVSDKNNHAGDVQSRVCASTKNHQSVSGLRGEISSTGWKSWAIKGILQPRVSKEKGKSDLPYLQQDIRQTCLPHIEGSSQLLLSKMQRSGEGPRVEISCTQRESGLERGNKKEILGVNKGAKQPRMEGWGDISQSERQLRKAKDQICSLPSMLSRDGEERWLCDGTQTESRYTNRQITYSDRVCSPHQSRCDRQSNRELNVIQEQSRSQDLRSTWSTSTTLATIIPQFYEGVMWCVRVPYGAFVARRNGKVFVTGNSGFPKSLNLAKSIEGKLTIGNSRYSGNKMETDGSVPIVGNQWVESANRTMASKSNAWSGKSVKVTLDQAQMFEGYGTALKPAWEPVVVGIKK